MKGKATVKNIESKVVPKHSSLNEELTEKVFETINKMAAHLFNESGQMQEVDIPDIFDVLEGGEDESAVKFLLGFNADDAATNETANEILNNNGLVQQVLTSSPLASPLSDKPISSPARVVVQIEPPTAQVNSAINASDHSPGGSGGLAGDKSDGKPRKREPVDPSRCIYACDSCGKAFTTKFNLKRHINMHCSRSREAGVPIQGPPSASQPSRKHKKDQEPQPQPSQLKVRRVSTVITTTAVASTVTASAASVVTPQLKTIPVVTTKAYQEPMTVQLAVNAQGGATAPRTATLVTTAKPSLPVQPLPESAVQILQSLGNGLAMSSGNTQRIVRVINAPQIIATQSRAGITTGATVQLQAIPVTTSTITFPQQPVPLIQMAGNRQIVLTSSNNLNATAKKVETILQPVQSNSGTGIVTTSEMLPTKTLITPVTTLSTADLIYRTIVSSKTTGGSSGSLAPLQSVVSSSTISSPTCGLNDGPPADLFDSEDGDALSVATTTETPTPPPSLNGDPILGLAVKSPPGLESLTESKVVVLPQPVLDTIENNIDEDDGGSIGGTLPSNRFHGQLTSIPKGWLRKVVTTSKGFQKVFYYNPVGKRFSCQEEIDQYFARLGYSVPMSLFNFELPKLVDEEDSDADLEDELDEAANINKTLVVKVTSNAKGEATVTPTTSTVVALPSVKGTIVTRADTTVENTSSQNSSPTAQQPQVTTSLVTSSTKMVTIGLKAVGTPGGGVPQASKTTST